MTSKTLLSAVVSLGLCGAALFAAEQRSAAQSAGQTPGVVHIDVAVTDANGQPVRDLAAADFTVLEDGTPATVTGMAAVQLPPAPAVASAPATAQAVAHSPMWTRFVPTEIVRNDDVADRIIAIVIDDVAPGQSGAQEPWTTGPGLTIAREIVNRLGPGDRAAVFFTFMGRQQGFTSDRAKLLQAIDGFTLSATAPTCDAANPAGGCVVSALQRVADALPENPPSRSIVAFVTGALGVPDADPLSNGPTAEHTQRLLRTLQRANATVFTFGSIGTPVAGGVEPGRFAADTGGRAFVDSAAPAGQVASMLDEVSSFYRIALRPTDTDGRFKPLTVRIGRAGVDARTRRGYFAPGGAFDAAPTATMTPLEEALVASAPATGMPLGTTVAVFGVPGRRESVVTIATNVTSRPVPGAAGWQADVAATAFDREWRPRSSHRQTIEVTARPDGGPQTVDVLSAIELLPGRYEVRVASESAGRAGSVFVDVDVPEFLTIPVSASGVVVSMVAKPYAALPLLADTLPVVPTTRRVFARTESVEAFVRFYQGNRGRLKNMPVSLTITNAAGDGIIQGDETILPSQFTEARSTDWRFTLPVGRLAAGEYLLTVEATLDDDRVARYLRFGVAK